MFKIKRKPDHATYRAEIQFLLVLLENSMTLMLRAADALSEIDIPEVQERIAAMRNSAQQSKAAIADYRRSRGI